MFGQANKVSGIEAQGEWETAFPFFQKILPRTKGECSLQEYKQKVLLEKGVLWKFWDESSDKKVYAVTLPEVHPTGLRTLNIVLLAGKGGLQFIPLMDQCFCLEATIQKCEYVVVLGRKGWAKALAQHQYEHTYSLLFRRV